MAADLRNAYDSMFESEDQYQEELRHFKKRLGVKTLTLPDTAKDLNDMLESVGLSQEQVAFMLTYSNPLYEDIQDLPLKDVVTVIRTTCPKLWDQGVPYGALLTEEEASAFKDAVQRSINQKMDDVESLLAQGQAEKALEIVQEVLGCSMEINKSSRESGKRILEADMGYIMDSFTVGRQIRYVWNGRVQYELVNEMIQEAVDRLCRSAKSTGAPNDVVCKILATQCR